jgi:predicted membrane chloride channel (bestrophin family)
MTPREASMACFDTSSPNEHNYAADEIDNENNKKLSEFQRTMQAILSPIRLAALDAVDVVPVSYNSYSFFSKIISIRGRNFSMLVSPLIALFIWGLCWQLLFSFGPKDVSSGGVDVTNVEEYLISMEPMISPFLTPISFLLVFRITRAAVRFWDARVASGKMVEICRTLAGTVISEFMAPIRLSNLRRREKKYQEERSKHHEMSNQHDTSQVQEEQYNTHKENEEDEEAIKLICEFSRWLAVFPIAVKIYLRPENREHWSNQDTYAQRRLKIGQLLSNRDADRVIMVYDDISGMPTLDSSGGVRARDPPLVVLNKLHELAYELAHFSYNDNVGRFMPSSTGRAIFHQQISEQINILFAAFGAMERIKLTPLPFVYTVHLRSILLIYLFLWNMIEVAKYEWMSLPFLFLINWSLLGIEAAAVECESPFAYKPNHLTLGKASSTVARNIAQALRELVNQDN